MPPYISAFIEKVKKPHSTYFCGGNRYASFSTWGISFAHPATKSSLAHSHVLFIGIRERMYFLIYFYIIDYAAALFILTSYALLPIGTIYIFYKYSNTGNRLINTPCFSLDDVKMISL